MANLPSHHHSAAQENRQRRAAKAGNKYGNPISLKSKLLAAVPDPRSPGSALLVAESAGAVRLVNVDVRVLSFIWHLVKP